ncbi:LppA family lipoprotein [Mycoplasma feriruminatoris]|uniref:LppA family lipoprotein n=1 Tax=Mycoplasma feriruminatoris TaxID=1179777 RepID=UPI00241FB97A|nr:LppA family lipoprotein [Mycoplasma feriruminatoris]WFQ91433.1 hypothetical protein MFERI14815_00014 [Mycoplasma feriruminatoris]WFQ93969.1 hypothetical protein MFERI15220_00014 [Mycoplasma feriruminatoris]
MKKATKLLLSILPISSIGFLSVVSCSTNKPNSQKPNNQNKPNSNNTNTNDSSSSNQMNPKEPTFPSGSDNPSKPENKPDDGEKQPNTDPKKPDEPKEPETPKEPSDQPQGDDPIHDQPHRDKPSDQPVAPKVDFSDLDKIKKEISFQSIYFYTQRNAETALVDLQKDQSTLNTFFSKDYKHIFDKYYIQYLFHMGEKAINQKGIIEKLQIKFTDKKAGLSKTIEFTLSGFKKTENKIIKNNKDNYITKKENIDTMGNLYPSLVGYMLLYSQDPNQYKNLMETKNVINFEDLENGNPSLFTDESPILNVATIKDYLFDYDLNLGELYKEKIVAVKYDDFNGILGLKVEIENRDHNPKTEKEPTIEKEFIFDNFRKVDLNDNKNNAFSVFLTQDKFKEMTKTGTLKTKIQELKSKNSLDKKELIQDSKTDFLKQQIFKNLLVDVTDNSHNAYKSQSTLSVGPNKTYKSILGLTGSMSIYPFHTMINKDSIKNIYVSITKESEKYKAKIEFEVNIPVFASTFSDLKSYATSGEDKTLVLKVSTNASID